MDDNTHEYRYRVESVEPTNAPSGTPDGIWHRYVIVRGSSQISGMKPGSLYEVTQHAEEEAQGYNERFAKGGTTYVSRKKT